MRTFTSVKTHIRTGNLHPRRSPAQHPILRGGTVAIISIEQ